MSRFSKITANKRLPPNVRRFGKQDRSTWLLKSGPANCCHGMTYEKKIVPLAKTTKPKWNDGQILPTTAAKTTHTRVPLLFSTPPSPNLSNNRHHETSG
jgi:hypothetical protein